MHLGLELVPSLEVGLVGGPHVLSRVLEGLVFPLRQQAHLSTHLLVIGQTDVRQSNLTRKHHFSR